MQTIKGKLVSLRPATMEDREHIYQWLALSDLTTSMLGPPRFPDNPVPGWDEFINDYKDHFFDQSRPRSGRCFIILRNGEAIGQVNHDKVYEDGSTELDIWLKDSSWRNKGFGTDALVTLCKLLYDELDCRKFYIAPSARNIGAIKSYSKAGFVPTQDVPVWFVPDYTDTLVMVNVFIPHKSSLHLWS